MVAKEIKKSVNEKLEKQIQLLYELSERDSLPAPVLIDVSNAMANLAEAISDI